MKLSSTLRLLAAAGLTLLSLAAASAQTVIVNTIGTGAAFGIDPETGVGGNNSNGRFIGIDPSTASPVTPKTADTAGYAVQPFTVNSLPGGVTSQPLFSVEIILNSRSTTGTEPSNLDKLYGAIFLPNTSGSPSLAAATQVGSTFRFDTSQVINPISIGEGDNRVRLLTAINADAAGITLQTGQTYWLVVMPKNGLNAQSNEALFQWGIWQSRASSLILNPENGGVIMGTYASAGLAMWEQGGARAGAILTPINSTYFAARVAVGVAPAIVSGTITFQVGLENVPRNQPLFLTFTPTGSTGGGIINQTVTPDASGNFTSVGIPRGTYRLRVKTTYSLSAAANVNLSSGSVSGVNFTLKGGDSNSDNVVDVTDLLAIINSYNQKRDTPANNPNYKQGADVNSDGANDVADLLLIINNYNQQGVN